MQEVVIIGAGKIGRGYMAQIFSEAGYQITFVDILPDLIAELNKRGSYEIHEVDTGRDVVFLIENVRALHAQEREKVALALSHVSLAVTSVGAGNLPAVAVNIADAVQYRLSHKIETHLNILIAENLMNGAQRFTAMVQEHLNEDEIAFMEKNIGIVATVIGRTVPPPPPSFAGQSIANVIVEPHREFYAYQPDFVGEQPKITGVKLTNQYQEAVSRKLYVHNCTHAVMGYIGHYYDYKYSHEAMQDERVSSLVWQAMQETAQAVHIAFGFTQKEMNKYITDLYHRYQNQELWDTLVRVDRDPIRKLQPDDRLVGAARLIEQTGGNPEALVQGIAAAFCYHAEGDEKAALLQEKLRTAGIEAVLPEITGISYDEPLGERIVSAYKRLRQA